MRGETGAAFCITHFMGSSQCELTLNGTKSVLPWLCWVNGWDAVLMCRAGLEQLLASAAKQAAGVQSEAAAGVFLLDDTGLDSMGASSDDALPFLKHQLQQEQQRSDALFGEETMQSLYKSSTPD